MAWKGRYTDSQYQSKETEKYLKNKVLKENLNKKDQKTANTIIKQLRRSILEWEDKI